jgi:hypothetical protein
MLFARIGRLDLIGRLAPTILIPAVIGEVRDAKGKIARATAARYHARHAATKSWFSTVKSELGENFRKRQRREGEALRLFLLLSGTPFRTC